MKKLQIRKKSAPKKVAAVVEDSKKESQIKLLVAALATKGYTIRREKLKQGHGWKTVSGACRLSGDRILFVDRKMPLDEQLLFLTSIASQLNLSAASGEGQVAGSSPVAQQG
jgi:hypothetical protein